MLEAIFGVIFLIGGICSTIAWHRFRADVRLDDTPARRRMLIDTERDRDERFGW